MQWIYNGALALLGTLGTQISHKPGFSLMDLMAKERLKVTQGPKTNSLDLRRRGLTTIDGLGSLLVVFGDMQLKEVTLNLMHNDFAQHDSIYGLIAIVKEIVRKSHSEGELRRELGIWLLELLRADRLHIGNPLALGVWECLPEEIRRLLLSWCTFSLKSNE